MYIFSKQEGVHRLLSESLSGYVEKYLLIIIYSFVELIEIRSPHNVSHLVFAMSKSFEMVVIAVKVQYRTRPVWYQPLGQLVSLLFFPSFFKMSLL